MTGQLARERGGRAAALWILAIGFIGAVLTGLSAASWLQGSLAFGCSWAAGGTEVPDIADGSWVCSGGIVLIGPGLATVGLGTLAVAAMLLVVQASWQDPRGRRGLIASAGILAVLPAIVICLLLLWNASAQSALVTPGAPTHLSLWIASALPATLTIAAAGVVAAVGLRMRANGRAGRLGAALVVAALALLLLAAALSQFGTLSTGLIAAGIIGAGWYIAAAVGQGPGEVLRESSAPMSIAAIPDRRPG